MSSRSRRQQTEAHRPQPTWKRMLTGDRPTGRAPPRPLRRLAQDARRPAGRDERFVLIADLHVLTTRTTTWSEIGDNIRECVLDYLSVGIDPQKTTIYLQSLVPEVLELFWLFMPLVGVPRAQRIPTLKDQVRDLQLESASMALLSYPVLQSADILMVKGDVVPVGKDQALAHRADPRDRPALQPDLRRRSSRSRTRSIDGRC